VPIYTRAGDDGETGLFGNRRVRKSDLRIETYGTVDELNACLGLVRAEGLPREIDEKLAELQALLFEVGADLASPGGRSAVPRVEASVAAMERWIDALEQELPPLRSFILPAGHREAALLHVARTVCRRAERLFWELADRDPLPPEPGKFLNRLSDLLFVLARDANRRHRLPDVPWLPPRG
jgi:cob(I)alamin adenosyltransferase